MLYGSEPPHLPCGYHSIPCCLSPCTNTPKPFSCYRTQSFQNFFASRKPRFTKAIQKNIVIPNISDTGINNTRQQLSRNLFILRHLTPICMYSNTFLMSSMLALLFNVFAFLEITIMFPLIYPRELSTLSREGAISVL